MIAILDYGSGNLFSVKNALDYLQFDNLITDQKKDLEEADKIILPGVGAFPMAMNMLRMKGLDQEVLTQSEKKPILGICLGMQMLFDSSDEFQITRGLSLIPGKVTKIRTPHLKIPHMGWSGLNLENDCALSKGIHQGDMVYYVHSYKVETEDTYISLYSDYGGKIPGMVYRNNIYGTQFHPEKSGKVGLTILKNFGELK